VVDKSNAPPAPKADDPPKTSPKENLASSKERLAELEKAIAAEEKRLADLKTEADTVRKGLADEHPSIERVYHSGEELFVDMPRSAYPKTGTDAGIERAEARKWLKAKLIGRSVEWTAIVREVVVKEDLLEFNVELKIDHA
jgi:hypothetical protein